MVCDDHKDDVTGVCLFNRLAFGDRSKLIDHDGDAVIDHPCFGVAGGSDDRPLDLKIS